MTLVAKCAVPDRRASRAVGAALAVGVPAVALWAAARSIPRVQVEGDSMQPAFAPGDRLLVMPWLALRPGDIVALRDPRNDQRLLVKRVARVDHVRRLVAVEGDNRGSSTDSRSFGPVPIAAIVGKAVYRYAPRTRAGPVGNNR